MVRHGFRARSHARVHRPEDLNIRLLKLGSAGAACRCGGGVSSRRRRGDASCRPTFERAVPGFPDKTFRRIHVVDDAALTANKR